jgi:hypothetical protein
VSFWAGIRNAARLMARNKSVVINLSKVKNTFADGCKAGGDGRSGRGREDGIGIGRWHARAEAVHDGSV